MRDLQYSRERARSETRLPQTSRSSYHPAQWGAPGDHISHYDNSYDNHGQTSVLRGRSGQDSYRYKSLDCELSTLSSTDAAASNETAGFSTYQKLITPGLFSAKRLSLAYTQSGQMTLVSLW